jgi:hypothetical protein
MSPRKTDPQLAGPEEAEDRELTAAEIERAQKILAAVEEKRRFKRAEESGLSTHAATYVNRGDRALALLGIEGTCTAASLSISEDLRCPGGHERLPINYTVPDQAEVVSVGDAFELPAFHRLDGLRRRGVVELAPEEARDVVTVQDVLVRVPALKSAVAEAVGAVGSLERRIPVLEEQVQQARGRLDEAAARLDDARDAAEAAFEAEAEFFETKSDAWREMFAKLSSQPPRETRNERPRAAVMRSSKAGGRNLRWVPGQGIVEDVDHITVYADGSDENAPSEKPAGRVPRIDGRTGEPIP